MWRLASGGNWRVARQSQAAEPANRTGGGNHRQF